MNFIAFLQHLPPWQLRTLAIGIAVCASEVVVSGMSWLLHGHIAYDYLLTGLVASGLVSYVVLSIMTLLLSQLADNQLKLHTIIEAEPECVKLVSQDGRLLQMNQAGLMMLEADSPEQVIGHPVYGVLLPEHRAAYRAAIIQVFQGKSVNLEFEIQGLHGTHRWLHSHAVPLRDVKGNITAMLSLTRDITEQKSTYAALQAAQRHTELLLNSMAEGVYGINLDGYCTFVNHSFLALLGYQHPDELLGKQIHSLIHHTHADGSRYPYCDCPLDHANLTHAPINLSEEVFWRKNGTSMPVECWTHPLLEGDMRIGTIVTFVNISERKDAEQKIRHLAYYDALTQLPNRRLLHDRLEQAMATSHRTQRYIALMFLDLDNFKPLNDRYGHDVGDMLLIEVAHRIAACTRQMDTVARFGGDEFIVMIRELDSNFGTSQIQAHIVAEKIRYALTEKYLLNMQINQDSQIKIEHQCSSSIGVVLFKDRDTTQDNLLKWADTAMYQAKEAGGNTIRFYQENALNIE